MMDCVGYGKRGVKRGKSTAAVAGMPNVWVDIEKPTKAELDEVAKRFGLHPLAMKECMAEDRRPKMSYFEKFVLITFKALDYADEGKMRTKHLAIFLGDGFIVTVHNARCPELEGLKGDVGGGSPAIIGNSADYLLYMMLSAIIDDYLMTLDRVEDDLEVLENLAAGKPQKGLVQRIFAMKKANIAMRKVLWPEREVLSSLEKGGSYFIAKRNGVYFRELHDHMFQTIDMNEGHRDIITGILDIHLSSISVSLNEVVKTLTVISAFVLVPTLIASIYGMNFVNMPEIKWGAGYLWALWLMAMSTAFTYFWFRKKSWI